MVDTFFNTEADRDLWLKLCAEHQIAWEKGLTYFDKESGTHKPTLQALNHRTMDTALEIARRQLNYDIKTGKLRFTLEDYLLKTGEELEAIRLKRHQEWCKKFESL